MCRRTACSASKDSLFCTSFSGESSTVTFYEVQLQLLLLLHQRHNFQKCCRNSRLAGSWSGRYYPLEGWCINLACLKEQKTVSAVKEFFVFIYLYFLFSPRPFSNHITNIQKKAHLSRLVAGRRTTGIKKGLNVILISHLSTNKMLHMLHFLKLS